MQKLLQILIEAIDDSILTKKIRFVLISEGEYDAYLDNSLCEYEGYSVLPLYQVTGNDVVDIAERINVSPKRLYFLLTNENYDYNYGGKYQLFGVSMNMNKHLGNFIVDKVTVAFEENDLSSAVFPRWVNKEKDFNSNNEMNDVFIVYPPLY